LEGDNMGKVKCADCRFLAVRKCETREIVDAEDLLRQKGELPIVPGRNYYPYEDNPICFVRAFDLRDEIGVSPNVRLRLDVVQRERDCGKFTDWQQGFSPKEHLEMLIEEATRRREERRDELQREWQGKETDKADRRHGENLKAVTQAGWTNVWSAIIAAILGAIVGAWAAGKQAVMIQMPQQAAGPSATDKREPKAAPDLTPLLDDKTFAP
jgi:hypothetical protein